MTIPRALAVFLLSLTFTAGAFAANPLPNPGFEEGVTGWKLDGTMSTVSAEAAHTGKAGLRVVDKDTAAGSSVTSSRLPIEAAKPVTLTFWAKADGDFAGVYLNFYDAAGKVIKDPAEKFGGGSPVCGIKKQDGGWHEYRFPTKAPEGAAAVALWIHSFGSATGTMDLDDFALEGIAEGATPVLAVTTAPAAKAAAAVPLDLPPRKSPPVIIVKVDDLRQVDGKVPGPLAEAGSVLPVAAHQGQYRHHLRNASAGHPGVHGLDQGAARERAGDVLVPRLGPRHARGRRHDLQRVQPPGL